MRGRQFRPYVRAAADQFSPKRRTLTQRLLEKLAPGSAGDEPARWQCRAPPPPGGDRGAAFTVAVLVPVGIARSYAVALAPGQVPREVALQLLGVALLAVGLALFVASLRRFASEGDGTLAPWDPPRRLVVPRPVLMGPQPDDLRRIFVLAAEALILRSAPHATWAASVFVVNAIYIPLLEEPMLEARFGDDYREYCRHVGRLLRRVRPVAGPRS